MKRATNDECRVTSEKCGTHAANSRHSSLVTRHAAFTLIEIMVVVGIMGIILAAGIPSLYKLFHKEGFRKTVNDIVEVCTTARARAILGGSTTEIVFHPLERRCEVSGGGGAPATSTGGKPSSEMSTPAPASTHSASFAEGVTLEMLDVNLHEYKDADVVKVRFFPNGTSDEMTIILRSDKGEWRKIALELTTGLVLPIETDPNKWK